MSNLQVAEFWKWFIKNSGDLQSNNYDGTLMRELDQIICDWDLVWEIGPGLTKPNSLTISPNGNKKLLDKAKGIIDKAPKLDSWEFYHLKQPKENWHKANLVDKAVDIDALDWTYVLFKYDDHKIEIVLKADNLANLDRETKELAVDLVLTNLLGEKLKIEKIDFIDIVDAFENEKGVTQLKFLPAHLLDKKYFR
jgi:hypothetical protein